MTITQMRYYVVVCEQLNFTKASEILGVTQPAVSSAVKDLEKECQAALFVRNKNALALTDEGIVLLEEIRTLLSQYDNMMGQIERFHLSRKYVRVGFTTLFGNYVYSDILTAFARKYPDIQLQGEEGSVPKLFQMLKNGRLDVVLAACPPYEREENFRELYESISIEDIELRFCVSIDHPLASSSSVNWEEMAAVPLILMSDRFSQSAHIREKFRKQGLEPRILHYTDQVYTVERFIENNAAAGFLPAPVAARNRYIAGIPIKERKEKGHLELFWRKNVHQFQSVQRFIQTVQEYVGKIER